MKETAMINSIIKRHDRLNPFNETQIQVIRSATKLFFEYGYTKTTFRMIESDSGVKVGNITYYFHSKDELLKILVEELMDFHATAIEDINSDSNDPLLAYATEIAAQIAICEIDRNAWDLYYSSYSIASVYEYIKHWGAEKNYAIFKHLLPDWSEHDFRNIEAVAAGIELAAMKTQCDRIFTLDKKIEVVLDSLLKLYEVKKEERVRVIEKILSTDYKTFAKDMFGKFVKRLE